MRLVDADKLINDIVHKYGRSLSDAVLEIAEAPTVEAEPIRHGKWIVDEDGNIKCSECGHCGADVDDFIETLIEIRRWCVIYVATQLPFWVMLVLYTLL